MLRPDTIDVRGLAVASGVAVALTVGYIAYFMTAIALLDLVGVTDPPASALALIGLVGAVAVHPVGTALRGVMDEILFGGRPDPLAAATRVVDTIGADPQEALDAVRAALLLPYLALRRGDDVLARSGALVDHTREFVSTGEAAVEVGLRPGELRLSPGDVRVLRLVTPLMVQLARATELSQALQQSRAKALTGIADERRRLRNELHDDLGPTLTGIALTIDAARNVIQSDSRCARELLDAVRSDISDAIAQIRHLVYGMRPPALDEMGLVEALRQQSRGLVRDVDFVVKDDLGELPAAVEVAAYRIVMESLTNAARHGRSDAATVTLARDADTLHVEVTDDGAGTEPWQRGVGLASMHERVAEVGGTLFAGPGRQGGEVRATLPLSV
jgi:signal transduction histidine kinase